MKPYHAKGLFIIILWLAFPFIGKCQNKETQEDPKPTVIMLFDQDKIKGKDSLRAIIQVYNNSTYDLTNLHLIIYAPAFLEWHDVGNNGIKILGNIPILKANSKLITDTLSAKIKSDAGSIGEFNILFNVEYHWLPNRFSHITIEKKITIDLLGTADTILGIPLTFAGFFVPGFIFLFVFQLSLFIFRQNKTPVSVDLGTVDKMIISFFLSILCILLLFPLIKLFPNSYISRNFNITNTSINFEKFTALALSGLIFGFIAAGLYSFHLKRQNKKEEKLYNAIINHDLAAMLENMLILNPNFKGTNVIIRTKDESYPVTHYVKTQTLGMTYIFGSFKIKTALLPEEIRKIIFEQYTKTIKNAARQDEVVLIQDPGKLLKLIKIIKAIKPKSFETDKPLEKLNMDFFILNNDEVISTMPDWNEKINLLRLL